MLTSWLTGIDSGILVQEEDPCRVHCEAQHPAIERQIAPLGHLPGWRDPNIAYLKDGVLPNDRAEAQKLQHLATRYILLGDVLYKKFYTKFHSDPYLRCLRPDEAKEVTHEIHDGYCGDHARGDPLLQIHQPGVLLVQDV